jgi:uncharacterized OB-fold protein
MDIGIVAADGRSVPFFEAAGRDVLLIKRCASCGHWLDPQATDCTDCGSADPPWAAASGRGALISWAVPHHKQEMPGMAAVLALVELDEGPWLHTCLDGGDDAGLHPGLRLVAHFEHPDEGESYPVFRPEGANPADAASWPADSSP